MRQSIVIGNWKMNGTRDSVRKLLDALKTAVGPPTPYAVAVCPPFVYLAEAAGLLAGSGILLGAQNVADQAEGPFTGEVAPSMLRECGCTMAIVGHSERRVVYGESDELVAARYQQAIAGGLTPILCVGETLQQRENNQTFTVLDTQLNAIIARCGAASLAQAIVAYEPVWAIGTGITASPAQAQEAHAVIRGRIATHDPALAESLRILYGGSVKPDNAVELFHMPDIDGGLIGGASLDANSFIAICKAAE